MARNFRDSTPFIVAMRNMFFGKPNANNPLRFEPLIAPRSVPPANLPDGVTHKLHNNYYYTRDGRRDCIPPAKVFISGQKVIQSGTESDAKVEKGPPQPGFRYKWD